MRALLLIPILTSILGCQSELFASDLASALRLADQREGCVLLAFTVGARCASCAWLEEDIWTSAAYIEKVGTRVVHHRVECRNPSASVADRVLEATARPTSFPELYLLDPSGWPVARVELKTDETAVTLAGRLLELWASTRNTASRARGQGLDGYRSLLKHYGDQDVRLGETMAAAALFDLVGSPERATLAPLIVGAVVARNGDPEPMLTASRAHRDGDGRNGWIATLQHAGFWALSAQRNELAALTYHELIGAANLALSQELNARHGYAFALQALGIPCHAIAEFDRCLQRSKTCKDAEGWTQRVTARRNAVTPCPMPDCLCDARLRRVLRIPR